MRKAWLLVSILFIIMFASNSINVLALSTNIYINSEVVTISNKIINEGEVYSLTNLKDSSMSVVLNEEEPLGGFSLFAPFITIIVLILGIILLIYVIKADWKFLW